MSGLWATRPWKCPVCTYAHRDEQEAQFLTCKMCGSVRRPPELDNRVAAKPPAAAQPPCATDPASPDGVRALPVKPEPAATPAGAAPVDDALMALMDEIPSPGGAAVDVGGDHLAAADWARVAFVVGERLTSKTLEIWRKDVRWRRTRHT